LILTNHMPNDHLLTSQSSQPSALRAQDVSKVVALGTQTLTILRDVNFAVERGESLAIVGPSGSGKSTLLALLAGLDLPTSGALLAGDQTISAMDEEARAAWRARDVGFVFQAFQLLPALTALENVMLPLELAGWERRPRRVL
jgi:putative ABC transport system ATP-binding protein